MAEEFEGFIRGGAPRAAPTPAPGDPGQSPGGDAQVPGDSGQSPGGSALQGDTEKHEYRNKAVINQRGATVEINNSTDREELKLSQYSGSNIALTNVVNSELATNNKQVQVTNDSFETVGSDKSSYVGKDKVERVSENTYILRGFANNSQLGSYTSWKSTYRGIASDNSQFRMLRGGFSFPNGVQTNQDPVPDPIPPPGQPDLWKLGRSKNPTINPFEGNRKPVLNNSFWRAEDNDPELIAPTKDDVIDGSGGEAGRAGITPDNGVIGNDPNQLQWATQNRFGSQAPGVMEFGGEYSSSTEGGRWKPNPLFVTSPVDDRTQQQQNIIDIQNTLNDYEIAMGNGGDEIAFVKRHKIETIGAATNNYPSTRLDPKGRSQPIGIDVGENTSYENMDYISHVEEIDNDMAFPGGNYTLNVGNRYNVLVGSGGIQLKTSGSVEMGGAVTKIAGAQVTIQASSPPSIGTSYEGPPGGGTVHIGSDGAVAIQAQKSVSLRSNRQVLVSPSLGVKHNLKVGGGTYVEGEVYLHHITAPMVKYTTSATGTQFGKFNTFCDRQLKVAEAALDIRKLKEQLDWVEQDEARRQAEEDEKARPLGEVQEEAARDFFDDFKQDPANDLGEGELFEDRGVDFWRDQAADAEWNQQLDDFNNGVEGAQDPNEGWNPGNDPNNWGNWDPRLAVGEGPPKGDYICWYPVFALKDDNLIKMEGHQHEYNGLPVRFMASNADVRRIAMCEGINRDDGITPARKASDGFTPDGMPPIQSSGIRGGCSTTYTPTTPPLPIIPPSCPEVPDCSCEDPTTPEPPATTYEFDGGNPGEPSPEELAANNAEGNLWNEEDIQVEAGELTPEEAAQRRADRAQQRREAHPDWKEFNWDEWDDLFG